jgi:hypothetical protein
MATITFTKYRLISNQRITATILGEHENLTSNRTPPELGAGGRFGTISWINFSI